MDSHFQAFCRTNYSQATDGSFRDGRNKVTPKSAIEATVCSKGSIRQYSAYSGSIIAYGGFAWLPRQRKQIRHVTWQRRTCMLGSGGWNQATKNMEAGTWRLGSWIQESRTSKRVPSKPFPSKRRLGRGSVAKRSWGGSPRHRTDPACPGG